MKPVQSSSLLALGYNPFTQTLLVQFKQSGSIYRYRDVPAEVNQALMASSSRGGFVSTMIRGHYDTAEINSNEVDFYMNEGKPAPKPRRKVSVRKQRQLMAWPGVFAFF